MRLADSNILIYSAKPEFNFLLTLILDEGMQVSAISIPEVLGYAGLATKEDSIFREIFSILTVFPVDTAVLYRASELRKSKRMKLGDAIIAATALLHGCELVTRNVSDFRGIPGLNITNPFPS